MRTMAPRVTVEEGPVMSWGGVFDVHGVWPRNVDTPSCMHSLLRLSSMHGLCQPLLENPQAEHSGLICGRRCASSRPPTVVVARERVHPNAGSANEGHAASGELGRGGDVAMPRPGLRFSEELCRRSRLATELGHCICRH